MILYTTVPQEMIFAEEDEQFLKYKSIIYKGVPVQVEQIESYYRIIRVLSSNPYDFMDSDLTPGQTISSI
ncbi:hypothetical protein J6TS2_00270 [Heyndrickxia sporothermodurans]|nr:hypothetical protein J6TS2_00270 [Heyndrickxia sporothermodurans]